MRNVRNLQTRGIVIKARNIGDSDKIITFLTEKFGKVEAKAKGARRILSKFYGHMEKFSLCSLDLYKSGSGTFTITQCRQIKSFKKIKENLDLIPKAGIISEIVYRNIEAETESEEFFGETLLALKAIEEQKDKMEEIMLWYYKKLLGHLGLLPQTKTDRNRILKLMKEYLNVPHAIFSTRKTF